MLVAWYRGAICAVPTCSLVTLWPSLTLQVRKFRTLTELIMDAEEHVKNPYKGKKLKVLHRNRGWSLKGTWSWGLSSLWYPRPAWLCRWGPCRHLPGCNPSRRLPKAPEATGSGPGPSPGYISHGRLCCWQPASQFSTGGGVRGGGRLLSYSWPAGSDGAAFSGWPQGS